MQEVHRAKSEDVNRQVPANVSESLRIRGLSSEDDARRHDDREGDTDDEGDGIRKCWSRKRRQDKEDGARQHRVDAPDHEETEDLDRRLVAGGVDHSSKYSCVATSSRGRFLLFSYVRHTYDPTTPMASNNADVDVAMVIMIGV